MMSETPTCSFCGQPPSESGQLVAGSGVQICDDCVWRCVGALIEEAEEMAGSKAHGVVGAASLVVGHTLGELLKDHQRDPSVELRASLPFLDLRLTAEGDLNVVSMPVVEHLKVIGSAYSAGAMFAVRALGEQ